MDNVVRIWGDGSYMTGINYAMTADGTLYSWGYNGWSSLGYEGGNQEYIPSPYAGSHPLPYQDVPRQAEIGRVVDLIPDSTSVLFLKSDGSLWGLGANSGQELNLGQGIDGTTTPVKVLDKVAIPGYTASHSSSLPNTETSFTDVPTNAWYAQYTKTAAEAGLMNGTGGGKFSPGNTLSVAQVVTLAARLHAQEQGESIPTVSGAWYQGAYQYCISQGLFTSSQVPLSTMGQAATRFQMVELLNRAVPDSWTRGTKPISDGDIPDLRESAPYGDVVYQWYRAGIIQGDGAHRFNGATPITRAETAAILCRLAHLTPRV